MDFRRTAEGADAISDCALEGESGAGGLVSGAPETAPVL